MYRLKVIRELAVNSFHMYRLKVIRVVDLPVHEDTILDLSILVWQLNQVTTLNNLFLGVSTKEVHCGYT